MNKNLLVALYLASGVVLLASFLTWLSMKAQIPANFPFETDAMNAFMAEAMTATGWRGDVTLFGITMPNWLVPLAAVFVALTTALRNAGKWNTPHGLSIGLAAFCTVHLGTIVLVSGAMRESTNLGFGAILGMVGSLGMLGLTIFLRKQGEIEVAFAGHGAPGQGSSEFTPQDPSQPESPGSLPKESEPMEAGQAHSFSRADPHMD